MRPSGLNNLISLMTRHRNCFGAISVLLICLPKIAVRNKFKCNEFSVSAVHLPLLKFERLLKAFAWILRSKSYMRAKVLKAKLTIRTGKLQVEDYEAARYAIVKTTQKQGFPDAAKCSVSQTDVNDPSTRRKKKMLMDL